MSNISHLGLDCTFSQYWGKTLQESLTAIAIIFSFLTNGLIVLLWCQVRGLRTAANCLILNLAIKGLLDAVVNGLVLFQFLIPNCRVLKHDYPLLNWFQVVECFFYFLNVLSILLLMLSKYCAVVYKLRYHVWNTKCKSLITIIAVWIVSGILDALFQMSLLSTWKKDNAKPETFVEFKRNFFKQAKMFWLVSLGVPMGMIAIFASMICVYLHLGLNNTRKLSYGVSNTKIMRVKDAVTNASVLNLATLENIVPSNERSALPEKNLNLEIQTQVYTIPTPFSETTKKQVEINKVKNSPIVECHDANSNINILHQFDFYLRHSKRKRKNLKESPKVFAFQTSGSTIGHCGLETESVLSPSFAKRFCLITRRDRSKSESDLLSINMKASFSGFLDLNCSEEQLIFPQDIDISLRSHLGLALRYSATEKSNETCLGKSYQVTRKRSVSEPRDKTRHLCNENEILSFIDLNKDTLSRKEVKKYNKETRNMEKKNAAIFCQTEFQSTSHQEDHEIGAYDNTGVSFEEEDIDISPNFPLKGSKKEIARQLSSCTTEKGFNPGIINNCPSTTQSKTFTLFTKIKRKHNSQAEANLVKSKISILLCAGAHIACYIPFLVEIILIDSSYDIAAGSTSLWLHFFSLYFILLNNICNPVLYCLKCDNFYQASISLMKSLKNKLKRNQPLQN